MAENVARVRARIAEAARRAGRSPDAVTLVAVTKTVSVSRVLAAAEAGVQDFGENYIQEARQKIPLVGDALTTQQPATWHLIGHLQRNKARYCPDLFALVQSVDSLALAQELGKHSSKRGKILPVLIEVNLTTDGDTRSGVAPEAALPLAEKIAREAEGVVLHGLMGMAPVGRVAEDARPHFARMRALFEALPEENRRTLSMGMSGDFEIAVEEGATLVRVGTALFGAR